MKQLMVFSLDQIGKPAPETDIEVVKGILFNSGLIARKGLGIYKGAAETCWLVEVGTSEESELIRALARAYSQESVLTVDLRTREAALEYLLDQNKIRKEVLGHWVRTDMINKENLTLDIESLNAYVVR